MASSENRTPAAFAWNVGGWFGTQIGCTLWLLILGFVLFRLHLDLFALGSRSLQEGSQSLFRLHVERESLVGVVSVVSHNFQPNGGLE